MAMPLSVRPCGVWMAALMNGPTSAWFQRPSAQSPSTWSATAFIAVVAGVVFPAWPSAPSGQPSNSAAAKSFHRTENENCTGRMLTKCGGMSSEREAGACVGTATRATFQPVGEYLIKKLPEQAAEWMPRICSALLVLFVFWLLAVVARKVVRKAGAAAGIDSSVINLLARSAYIVLMVVGLVTALGTLGIDVSAIVASLGLTGFAVGFALKDSISNLLSGVLILIHQPFNVGDSIKVKTFEGLVTAIDLRYTRLEQDGEKILVPNSLLFTNPISILPVAADEN